jgi:hypothetical protein
MPSEIHPGGSGWFRVAGVPPGRLSGRGWRNRLRNPAHRRERPARNTNNARRVCAVDIAQVFIYNEASGC